MNKPFNPEPIVPILARAGVSISDLKRNPAAVIAAAREQQIAILNRNKPVAYMISPEVWEGVLDMMEELEDIKLVEERLASGEESIPVTLDELLDRNPPVGAAGMEELDHDIKRQAVRKLEQLRDNPRVPSARLSGMADCYKIKLRSKGYRIVYQVIDDRLVIVVVAAAKRDAGKNDVYSTAMQRLNQLPK